MLNGHSEGICEVIFLPHGQIVSCSDDETIKVWDTTSGVELCTLDEHKGAVYSLALLPNGWLASGSDDTTIKLWDLQERKEVRTLRGHVRSIASMKVLSNGNLVSFSLDDTIKIWNPYLAENNLLMTIKGHGNTEWIIPLGVLSNDLLVTFFDDQADNLEGLLRVWDSKDGQLVKSLSHGMKRVWAFIVLSNDQVAIGSNEGTIKLIDTNDQSKTTIKEKAHEAVCSLLQLSNGNLVSAGRDKASSSPIYSIKLWNIADLSLLTSIESGHLDNIFALSINKDETLLASGSDDRNIKLWTISL